MLETHHSCERKKQEICGHLAAGGIVVFVGHRALGQFLPAAERGVSERSTELSRECDVVVTAAPAEVTLRLVTWHRTTAASDRRASAARLGHGVRQRCSTQSVDERLLTITFNVHSTATFLTCT